MSFDAENKASKILSLKDNWGSAVPSFRNKVSRVLNPGTEKASSIVNPFLDKNGNLFNPYIDYQKILDNSNVSTKVKSFIQQATGLTPSTPKSSVSQNGVVSSEGAVQPTAPSGSVVTQTGNRIADTAQKYLGTPYVWGGESMAEGGMDCRGFVYNALRDAGYNVGRTTAQGYRSYGNSVSKADMQPGDLVFFGKNGNASHIGIYLGNGQMIHSSGGSKNTKSNPGKGVSITNVDYRSDFIEARRY